MPTTINLSVGSGETKNLTFNCGGTFVPDDIQFVITGSGGDTNTTLSGVAYCSTVASTTAKVATMPGFALSSGQRIILYLSTTNSKASATLNVNSTGAKTIKIGGANTTTSNFTAGYWVCEYDGTNWNLSRLFADVKQDDTTTSSYRKVILSGNAYSSAETAVSATTGQTYATQYVEVQPSTGKIRSKGFVKSSPTNGETAILLANGTDIAQSTFAQSTHSHYITDLADVYTDSQRIDEVLAFNGSIWQGMYVAKTVNAGSGLNATSGDTTNDGGYIGWGTSGGSDASVPTGTLHLTRVNTESSYDGSAKPGFGPTTNTTVSSSSNTFTVPYYKVDKFGRVTESANKTITISGLGTGGGGGDTVTGKSNVTLSTTATAVLQVNGSDSGSVALPSAPPSTWLGTTETTAAAGSHGHGTITNGGYIRGAAAQAGGTGNNQVAIANGDRIVIADYSGRTSTNYFPLKLTSIVFDGSTTTQFLSKKGTWETPSGGGNISAISPESLIQGYTAGGVVIGQERTEFIVPPARIVESGAASEYNLQRQGVVRPQYEIDATTWEDTLALNSGRRFNDFNMIIVPTIPKGSGINACCFLPITVMYRYNTVTSRYESVPGILINTDISKPFEMYDIKTQFMFRQKQ